jgi:hypothetical protein
LLMGSISRTNGGTYRYAIGQGADPSALLASVWDAWDLKLKAHHDW